MPELTKQQIQSGPAPHRGAPYSQAIRVGDLVFTAGQIGADPITGYLVSDDAVAQTHQALRNLGALLETAGSGLNRLVKTTVFLADLDDRPAMHDVYSEYVHPVPPARSSVQVGLPAGVRVEIEAVAHA